MSEPLPALTDEELAEWEHRLTYTPEYRISKAETEKDADLVGIPYAASDPPRIDQTYYFGDHYSDADPGTLEHFEAEYHEFAVDARAVLPRLLADLTAARAEIERLRETLTFIRDSNWYTVKGLQESAARALVASPGAGEGRKGEEMPKTGIRGVVDGPEGVCPCRRCLEAAWKKKEQDAEDRGEPLSFFDNPLASRMILCAICGNKRCPHATFHENACSNSNLPGQEGSDYR